MQIRRVLPILTLLLATAFLSANATVNVTNLHLVKNGQFTELTISCDANCEFSHQIVEEAPNKPYRIVVDIKDAIHNLPQHAYTQLPSGMVKQIRTSQFSTDPENVVRVVVDAAGSLTYKVKSGEHGVTLFINTPSDQNFPHWSAVPGSTPPPVMAENDAPNKMPAFPGNEQNAPKVDKSDPAKKELRLTARPIDEGTLLNNRKDSTPVQNQQPEVASQPANTQATNAAQPGHIDPKLLEAIYGKNEPAPTVAAETSAKPSEPAKTDSKATPAAPQQVKPEQGSTTPAGKDATTQTPKLVDSAVAPELKIPGSSPLNQPTELVKPPKAQKTALPDVKVNPKPAFAGEDSANAQDSKLATTIKGDHKAADSSTGNQPGSETLAEGQSDQKVKSKSDLVREKYQAARDGQQEENEAIEAPAVASSESDPEALSKIDRIRLKYKRGIKFVQNDEEDEQMAYEELDFTEEPAAPMPQVGPYNEFLPEREIVVYNTGGRIDPFEPLVEDGKKNTGFDRIPDVESLRLVGILQDRKTSRALFEDANGYSYILQTGDRVKNGFVLSITAERVVFQIRQYGWNRQVALDLEESH